MDNSGTATFNGVVSGVGTLTGSGGGNLVVNNNISAGSIVDSETTTLNGTGGAETITTSAGQSYTAPVTLGANTTVNSGNVTFGSTIAGGDNNLTVNSSAVSAFGGAVSGVHNLTTDASGSTVINGGTVTTSGKQTYNDAVTLGAATTLTSSGVGAAGAITFGTTLNSGNGGQGLTVTTPGT